MKYWGLVSQLFVVKVQVKHPSYQKSGSELLMSPGSYKTKAEAEREYKKYSLELPSTRKLFDVKQRGSVYNQVFDFGSECLLIEANTLGDLYSLFEIIVLLVGFLFNNFSDDIYLIRLKKRPPKKDCSKDDLFHLVVPSEGIDKTTFESDITSGEMVRDTHIAAAGKLVPTIIKMSSIRKALACYCQSQRISYTPLAPSILSDMRPDLLSMPNYKYKAYNLLLKERMSLSFIAAYRGIEAAFNYRFSEKDFKRAGRNRLQQIIEGKIEGLHWNSRYRRMFYQIRHKRSPRWSYVRTMIKHFLIVRNRRAGHGLEWPHKTIRARVTIDMVHEVQLFLYYLIYRALFKGKKPLYTRVWFLT